MIDNPMSDVDDRTERMAKALLKAGGADPEQMVQPGRPQMYGTPQGEAFAVAEGAAVPLWRLYLTGARTALALAAEIDATPKPTVTIIGQAAE